MPDSDRGGRGRGMEARDLGEPSVIPNGTVATIGLQTELVAPKGTTFYEPTMEMPVNLSYGRIEGRVREY